MAGKVIVLALLLVAVTTTRASDYSSNAPSPGPATSPNGGSDGASSSMTMTTPSSSPASSPTLSPVAEPPADSAAAPESDSLPADITPPPSLESAQSSACSKAVFSVFGVAAAVASYGLFL